MQGHEITRLLHRWNVVVIAPLSIPMHLFARHARECATIAKLLLSGKFRGISPGAFSETRPDALLQILTKSTLFQFG
jgi:hypothetical protein